MAIGSFKAGVHYGDWEGTAAADDAHPRDIREWLREKGKLTDNQFLVGIDIFIGENHAGKVEEPYVTALIVEGSNDFENVAPQVKGQDPVQVISLRIELSIEEFLGLFKNFNIVLTQRGLDLTAREYEAPEE